MSTHNGKVTLDASWVQRLLILADQADLAAALAELANVKNDFDAAIEQRDKAIAFLHVYRNDTPLGHQPPMLTHEVDQFLKESGE